MFYFSFTIEILYLFQFIAENNDLYITRVIDNMNINKAT